MNIEFLPSARQDLRDIIDFYQQCAPAVNVAFEQEFANAIEIIRSFPLATRLVSADLRKLVLKRFPHLIIYTVTLDKIIVISVAHQHRHPRVYLH